MVAGKMLWTKWYGQNGIGQNGMDKMVYNFIFCVRFNSVKFTIIFRNQKSPINYKYIEES